MRETFYGREWNYVIKMFVIKCFHKPFLKRLELPVVKDKAVFVRDAGNENLHSVIVSVKM
jgi:hypothetical protein